MARKTKRTPETVKAITDLLRAGVPRTHACAASGVSHDSFMRWLDFADFAEAVKKAESDAVARNVAVIQQAARTTWQAAAWWLERRYPEDFRNRVEKDVTTGGKPLGELLGLSELPDDELDKRIERIKARKADKAI